MKFLILVILSAAGIAQAGPGPDTKTISSGWAHTRTEMAASNASCHSQFAKALVQLKAIGCSIGPTQKCTLEQSTSGIYAIIYRYSGTITYHCNR